MNNITLVHINGNDGDDLDTDFGDKWLSNTLNEGGDSSNANVTVFFHGGFGTTVLELFEGALGLLSPDNLGSEEGNLRVVVIEPEVARLSQVPLFSGLFGIIKDVLKSLLHLCFQIAQVALDGTNTNEGSEELNEFFTILRVHTEGSLVGFGTFT